MKTLVKIFVGFLFVIVVLIGFVATSFSMKSERVFAAPHFSIHEDVVKADIELGKRIVTVRNGCVDCHGEDLSGAKIMENGAMGSIYGANITPYGLKDWTDEEVATAIRYGIHKTGRSLRAMPSFEFASLSKGDIAAIIAYLRSVPEVQKPSHQNTYGPMARVLATTGQMPFMFPAFEIDMNQGFADKPVEGPTLEFGQYLAGSCIGCHGQFYQGGKIPGGDPAWPPASNIRLGANPLWTEASFQQFIETGVSPVSGQQIRPPMPVYLLQKMNDMEKAALWSYLSSLK